MSECDHRNRKQGKTYFASKTFQQTCTVEKQMFYVMINKKWPFPPPEKYLNPYKLS